jgi:uncharacterized protein YdeI (YjbR/CyaY-like superfamily)
MIKISSSIKHTVPRDLKDLLKSNNKFLTHWNELTPIARNEWICWIISVKKLETRNLHLKRAYAEIISGKKRPCCWPGCPHRKNI